VRGWAGGYRTLTVIGAILIGLVVIGLAGAMVIGLAGAMVIGLFKVSNKFENISGRDSDGPDPGKSSSYYQEGPQMAQENNNNLLDGIEDGIEDLVRTPGQDSATSDRIVQNFIIIS
jgi:hypothetical protein